MSILQPQILRNLRQLALSRLRHEDVRTLERQIAELMAMEAEETRQAFALPGKTKKDAA